MQPPPLSSVAPQALVIMLLKKWKPSASDGRQDKEMLLLSQFGIFYQVDLASCLYNTYSSDREEEVMVNVSWGWFVGDCLST